jgi:hypothetical protein
VPEPEHRGRCHRHRRHPRDHRAVHQHSRRIQRWQEHRVVRGNNQPDDILTYDWKTNFTINLQFNDAADDKDALTFPVKLSSATVKVQQASGGILTPPSGGDVEHYEFVTSATSNTFAAVGANVGITLRRLVRPSQPEEGGPRHRHADVHGRRWIHLHEDD